MRHLARVAVILTSLLAAPFYAAADDESPFQTQAKAISAAIQAAPTQQNVSAAVVLLHDHLDVAGAGDIESVLRNLLGTENRNLVLVALAQTTIRDFDLDLVPLLPTLTDNKGPDLDTILAAAARSGSGATAASLADTSWTPSAALFPIRPKLFHALYTLSPFDAVSRAIFYYLTNPAGLYEANTDPSVYQLLNDFNRDLASDPPLRFAVATWIARIAGNTRTFGVQIRPFDCGSPDSAKHSFLLSAESLYTGKTDSYNRAYLFPFAAAACNDIMATARSSSYTAFRNTAWLLPHTSPPLTTAAENEPLITLLKANPVQLSRDIAYDTLANWRSVLAQESGERLSGSLVTSDPFFLSPVDTKRLFDETAHGILQVISETYHLDLNGVDTAEPPLPTSMSDDYTGSHYVFPELISGSVQLALSTALQRNGQPSDVAAAIAAKMTSREFERRVVLLYALELGSQQTHASMGSVTLGNIDSAFDAFVEGAGEHLSSVSSSVVSVLPVKDNVTTLPSTCLSPSFFLAGREYSFNQGYYHEKFSITCRDGTTPRFDWTGAIPLSLSLAIRSHPRVLDLTAISLALRDLRRLQDRAAPIIDDIDVIRRNSAMSSALLLNALHHQEIPWADIRPTIWTENDNGIPLSFFLQTSKPLTLGAPPVVPRTLQELTQIPLPPDIPQDKIEGVKQQFSLGMPGGLASLGGLTIASTPDQFTTISDTLQKPFEALIKDRAVRIAFEAIRSHAEGAPEDTGCSSVLDVLCDAHITGHEDTGVHKLKQDLDVATPRLRAWEAYFEDWDVDAIQPSQISQVIFRTGVVSPTWDKITAVYEIRTSTGFHRFVTLTRPLGTVPSVLRTAATVDPFLFARFNLDLGLMSTGASGRISAAVSRVLLQNSGRLSSEALLNEAQVYSTDNVSALGVEPPAFLFNTESGRLLANEIALTNQIANAATNGGLSSVPDPGPPVPELPTIISALKSGSDQYVQSSADAIDAQPIKKLDAAKSASQQFSVYVTVTFSSAPTTIGVAGNVGQFHMDVGASMDGSVFVNPNIGGVQLPLILLKPASDSPASTQSNFNSDLALEIQPPHMSAEASLYVEPTRSPASITPAAPLTFAELPESDSGTASVDISMSWTQLPQLPPPVVDHQITTPSGARIWLGGLIYSADRAMTADEHALVWKELQTGNLSIDSVKLLSERSEQSLETDKIEDREWIRTSHIDDLLGPILAGKGPMSEPTAIAQYNALQDATFQSTVDALTQPGQKLFDGMPAVTLTYGNNYALMLWQYSYLLKDGSHITTMHLQETPFWLVGPVRKDPYGHVLEKLSAAVTSDMLNAGGAEHFEMLRAAQEQKFLDSEALRSGLGKVIDTTTGETLKHRIKTAIQEYMTALDVWARNQTPQVVSTPFVPPHDGVPMLNFFPSPYEWAERHNEPVEQVLLQQQDGSTLRQIRDGQIIIPDPNMH